MNKPRAWFALLKSVNAEQLLAVSQGLPDGSQASVGAGKLH